MGDSLKRYDEELKKWITSASGNATGIAVTDPRLVTPGKLSESLNDVLARQAEELAEHGGYIAWLAEHGGGGSGNGGGASDDAITLTNGTIIQGGGTNYLYSSVITKIRVSHYF